MLAGHAFSALSKTVRQDRVTQVALALFLALVPIYFSPWLSVTQISHLGDNWIDPLFLGLTIVAFLAGLRQIAHQEERRFWSFWSVAFAFWLASSLLWHHIDLESVFSEFLIITLHFGFYLAVFWASENKPHRAAGWSLRSVTHRWNSMGSACFLTGFFGYFVLIPLWLNYALYSSFLPELVAVLSLDVVLVVRFLRLRRQCPQGRWRTLYGWMLLVCGTVGINDFRELAAQVTNVRIPWGTPWDLLWYLQFLVAIVAVRMRRLPAAGSTENPVVRANPFFPALRWNMLTIYASVLPLFHFATYGASLPDPLLRASRELFLFGFVLTLGLMQLTQQKLLNRHCQALQTDLQVAEVNLQRARKMEAIGQMAGGIAHTFNNQLMVIRGHSDFLERDLAALPKLQRHALAIHSAVDRAAELTSQMATVSSKHVMEFHVLDLNEVVRSAQGLLLPLLGDHVELAVCHGPAPAWIRTNRNQIERLLSSLAANARDAMPKGGFLTLRAASVDLDEAFVRRNPQAQPGPHVLLAVSDSGTGMDSRTLAKVFEPFFTTKPVGQGMGLGLATTYGIIRQSGGHVTVESEPGRGTTIHMYFPRVAQPAACFA